MGFILFLIALLPRIGAVFWWGFDGLYGQDAFAYFQQAVAITERIPRGQLPPTDFFWPNGFPLLTAGAMLIAGPTARAAQFVSLFCGAALAPLAYKLSYELFPARGRRIGVLAGLIIAVAGQPILSSVVVMADMAALFWATLATWLLAHTWRARAPGWWLFGAGAALALAIVSRWLYVLLVPAFAVYTLYAMSRQKSPWWYPIPPTLAGFGIILPQLWLGLHRPEGVLHSWLLGWSPLNAFRRQFETVDGHFVYQWPVGIFYAEPAGHPAYLFPLLGLAALWGLWCLWREKNLPPLILLVGWAGPVYLFLAGIPYENFRFGLALYPPLALLAGFGLSDLWGHTPTRKIAQMTAVFSLGGMLVWAYPMLDQFLTMVDQSKQIARRVAQVLPADATLLSFGLTLTLQHYTRLRTREFFYLDSDALDTLTESRSPLYLLLDVKGAENQWQGKAPDVNYRWLKEHTTLTPVADFAPYSLFRVRRRTQIDTRGERQ